MLNFANIAYNPKKKKNTYMTESTYINIHSYYLNGK